MAEVYTVSEEIPAPAFPMPFKREAYDANVKQYMKDVETLLRERFKPTKDTGKVIRFGVADGYAEYMIISITGATMVHLEIGDAYHFQYAHLLTATEIRKELKSAEALKKLFG